MSKHLIRIFWLLLLISNSLMAQFGLHDPAFVSRLTVVPGGTTLIVDLIGYWRFDEASGNAADAHTNNLVLTNFNTATFDVGKITNCCVLVSNSLQYFQINDNALVSIDGGSFTLSGWVNPNSTNSIQPIITKNGSAGNRDYVIQKGASGIIQFNLYTNNTSLIGLSSTTKALTNAWTFFTAMYDFDNSEQILSVNGADWKTNTVDTYAMGATTPAFTIGRNVGGGTYFDGSIDEVGFWKKVLTADEITTLYNSGSGKTYPFQ